MTPTNLRPELARHLGQRIEAFTDGFRHNLALIGPLGSGKTFQLHALLAQRPARLSVIYCPLYRESCQSFLNRFLIALLQAGLTQTEDSMAVPQDTSAPQTVDAVLRRAEVLLPKTARAIAGIDEVLRKRFYGEAFSRALDAIPVLVDERRQPCVLILDEFLLLEELGLVHAFHELGKRVMTWESTLFVLASSSPYRARTILRERLQLLFGQFELLSLGSLDGKQVETWIQRELKGLRGLKGVSAFLTSWLAGYPWYLSLFLKRLRELASIARTTEMSEPLFLRTAWDLLGSPEGALHQWCASRTQALTHARQGMRAMEALLHIAGGARTATELGRRIGRGGLSGALQIIVEQDLVQRNGMCWVVTDPILRCWLSTVVSWQRSDARPAGIELTQRFEEYVRNLWSQWMRTHALSFSEQVAGLFSQFRDDTVSLDSKTGRLPTFRKIQRYETDVSSGGIYLVADGDGKRWCASVHETTMHETAISHFDAFCRAQTPKPARKVVITKVELNENARLFAKNANMWVWEPQDLSTLSALYGQP